MTIVVALLAFALLLFAALTDPIVQYESRLSVQGDRNVTEFVDNPEQEATPLSAMHNKYAVVIVTYDAHGVFPNWKRWYLDNLFDDGHEVYVVVNGKFKDKPLPAHYNVLKRDNEGYDFGGWEAALDRWPELATKYEWLLLTNDSYVPATHGWEHFRTMMNDMRSVPKPWGITSSFEIRLHVQSYFIDLPRGRVNDLDLSCHSRGDGSLQGVINNCELNTVRWLPDIRWKFNVDSTHVYAWNFPVAFDAGLPIYKHKCSVDFPYEKTGLPKEVVISWAKNKKRPLPPSWRNSRSN